MKSQTTKPDRHRRGAIVVLSAFIVVGLLGMVAFAVDHGYLLKVRTDMQRAADAAALAAVQDLIRLPDGSQDLDAARETVRAYTRENLGELGFQVAAADIEIGRYDPTTIYSNVTLLGTGTFDAVRVTLRRDGASNPSVPLYFARVLGIADATITATATAVLQKAQILEPGADVLPFATPIDVWDSLDPGDTWSGYGDGKLKDANGNDVPGNWGTLDIGATNNSTSDLNNQILDGLRQSDLDALYNDGRIPQDTHIDSSVPALMQADTGLSSGLKHSVTQIHGQKRLIPLYDSLGGQSSGNNVEFNVTGWGVATVVDSNWKGSKNTWVTLKKSHQFNGDLRPAGTLSNTSGYIDGAYTSPVLVE